MRIRTTILRKIAIAMLLCAGMLLTGLLCAGPVLADQAVEGGLTEPMTDGPSASGSDDLAKNGSIVVTCVVTDSWEGDDRAFEYWFEVGDCETYGELDFTLSKADGTTVSYVLDPDSDEREDVDILTNKEVVPHQSSSERNVFYAFTLRNGETATVSGIPERAHFQCYVASSSAGDHGTGYNAQYENVYSSTIAGGTSGTFGGGKTYLLTGTHRRYLRVIPVIKILLNGSGRADEFPFCLTLLEEDGKTPIANYNVGTGADGAALVTNESGVVEFSIAASRNAMLYIPAHANYEIEEVLGESERYQLYETPADASGFVDTVITIPCYFFNVEKYPISIVKQDDEGFLIAGATLQILDDGGTVVKEWVTEDGTATEVWLDLTTGDASHGIPKSYVLHEVSAPAGYKLAEDIGFTITYSSEAGAAQVVLEDGTSDDKLVMVDEDATRDVSVVKEWDDSANQDGLRPEQVRVQLLANGEPSGDPIVLNANNQWTHTWTGLDWHAGGKEVSYSVEELDVADGYAAAVTGNAEDGLVVTNVHVPGADEKSDVAGDNRNEGNENDEKDAKGVVSANPATGAAATSAVPQTSDNVPYQSVAAFVALGLCLVLTSMTMGREGD